MILVSVSGLSFNISSPQIDNICIRLSISFTRFLASISLLLKVLFSISSFKLLLTLLRAICNTSAGGLTCVIQQGVNLRYGAINARLQRASSEFVASFTVSQAC